MAFLILSALEVLELTSLRQNSYIRAITPRAARCPPKRGKLFFIFPFGTNKPSASAGRSRSDWKCAAEARSVSSMPRMRFYALLVWLTSSGGEVILCIRFHRKKDKSFQRCTRSTSFCRCQARFYQIQILPFSIVYYFDMTKVCSYWQLIRITPQRADNLQQSDRTSLCIKLTLAPGDFTSASGSGEHNTGCRTSSGHCSVALGDILHPWIAVKICVPGPFRHS